MSSYRLVIRPEADAELAEATRWVHEARDPEDWQRRLTGGV